MPTGVHSTAVVGERVVLGESVRIGPHCVIDGDVQIGAHTRIDSQVRITGKVRVGAGCRLHHCVCLGETAQNESVAHRGTPVSSVSIGAHSVLREQVTVHASARSSGVTRIGAHNLLMVGTHVGHDCSLGDHVRTCNLVQLAGGVQIEDHVYLSGGVLVDSRCRIGVGACVDASTFVGKDVPPFFAYSRREVLYRVRRELMVELGYDEQSVARLVAVGRRLRRGEGWTEIYASLAEEESDVERLLVAFLRRSSKGVALFLRPTRR